MARSAATSSSSSSESYSSGSSSDSGSSSGSDRRRRHRRHRKESSSSSALKARKDRRARHKRRRKERRRSPSDDDSYSSTSSYDSDREASGKSRRHKKSSRSRKSRERERSRDRHHKRGKSKRKEKKESEHADGPVQLSKFLGRDKEKEEGVQRSAISGKKCSKKEPHCRTEPAILACCTNCCRAGRRLQEEGQPPIHGLARPQTTEAPTLGPEAGQARASRANGATEAGQPGRRAVRRGSRRGVKASSDSAIVQWQVGIVHPGADLMGWAKFRVCRGPRGPPRGSATGAKLLYVTEGQKKNKKTELLKSCREELSWCWKTAH